VEDGKWTVDDAAKPLDETKFRLSGCKCALEDANKSLGIRPNDANTVDTRATAYQGLGDLNRAIADWEAAVKLASDNTEFRENLEKPRKRGGGRKMERTVVMTVLDYIFEVVIPSISPLDIVFFTSFGVPKVVDAIRFSSDKRIKELEKSVEDLKEAFFKHETGVTPKEWDKRQKGLVKQVSAIHGLR
jgi:tetratricopeptide (TPR) repeat protein